MKKHLRFKTEKKQKQTELLCSNNYCILNNDKRNEREKKSGKKKDSSGKRWGKDACTKMKHDVHHNFASEATLCKVNILIPLDDPEGPCPVIYSYIPYSF